MSTNTFFKDINVRITKFNRTASVIRGSFTLVEPLDDNLTMKMRIHGLQGNEFRQIMEKDVTEFCTHIATSPVFYKDFLDRSTLPKQSKDMCPIKPGFYEIKDFIMAQELPKHMFLGLKRWRVNAEAYYKGKFVYHGALYLNIA